VSVVFASASGSPSSASTAMDLGERDAAAFADEAIDPTNRRLVERGIVALEHQQQHLQRVRERDGAGRLACCSAEPGQVLLGEGAVKACPDDRVRGRMSEHMCP
jgi:hypothetical protein